MPPCNGDCNQGRECNCECKMTDREEFGNIIRFTGKTTSDLDADTVLENTKGKVDGFILAGYDKDGELWVSTTYGSVAESVLLAERFISACVHRLENE